MIHRPSISSRYPKKLPIVGNAKLWVAGVPRLPISLGLIKVLAKSHQNCGLGHYPWICRTLFEMPKAYNPQTREKRPTQLVSEFNIRKNLLKALRISISVVHIRIFMFARSGNSLRMQYSHCVKFVFLWLRRIRIKPTLCFCNEQLFVT